MILTDAKKIAVDVCQKLFPYSDKINIAGSVRRQKEEVKDIEVICQPKTIGTAESDLFGNIKNLFYRCPDFKETVLKLGEVVKGKPDGKYMQIKLESINLDLFIPDDYDYYRQYAIRTGSADYTRLVIAQGWLKKGWCGSDKGLRKISDCRGTKTHDGKTSWKCIRENADVPPVWESEESFFDWIGVKWIHPTKRFM
jgi:DNA polymerase/3'-5' exonuclease PolX